MPADAARSTRMRGEGTVTDTTPLRLAEAAEMAFPRGGMTAAGLRREAQRGRLALMRIAGKDFTTLAAIREMMDRCRVAPSDLAYGSGRSEPAPMEACEPPPGSSSTSADRSALDAALTIAGALKQRSPDTSPASRRRTGRATVIPLKSASRTSSPST